MVDLGGGGRPIPLRDSTRCRHKGLPLSTIMRYPYLVTVPKNFLRVPIYAKNAIFWSKFSKKCLKTLFLASFSKFCLRPRKFDQNRVCLMLWNSSENQFGRPQKKGRQSFRKLFENPPPPPSRKSCPPLGSVIQSDQFLHEKIMLYLMTIANHNPKTILPAQKPPTKKKVNCSNV